MEKKQKKTWELVQKLREWYKEALQNPVARNPYSEESLEFIDRYIAKRVFEEIEKARQQVIEEILGKIMEMKIKVK